MSRRYPYLNTRISIRAARLITRERLNAIVDQPAERLRHVGSLVGLDPQASESPESSMLVRLLKDFMILIRPLAGADRAFLTHALRRFELANLKAVVRGKLNRRHRADIETELVSLGPFARLPTQALLGAEDAAEALRCLQTTPYRLEAEDARRELENQHDAFSVDAAIDRRYFTGLLKRASSVSTAERPALLALMARYLECLNLTWLLRYRFAYGLSPARSFYFLIPAQQGLSADRLQVLAQQPSIKAVLEACPVDLARDVEGTEVIPEIEDRLEARMERSMRAALRDTRYVLARTFAYLSLKEAELRRVQAIFRGRIWELPPEWIRTAARTVM